MTKRVLVVCLIAALMAPTTAGATYRDTGYDPNDVKSTPDVRSTTRKVLQVDGRRVLAVVVRSYGRWPGWRTGFGVKVKLDTRGGPRFDAKLLLLSGEDAICTAVRNDEQLSPLDLGFSRDRTRIVCRVPMPFLGPNKRIRWKVMAGTWRLRHPDYAPSDRSWYV